MANKATKRQRRVNRGRLLRLPGVPAQHKKKSRAQQLSIREQVKIRDGFLCKYCGEPGSTLDHVVPKSRGGGNTLANLVWCCVRCNNAKGSMSAARFMVWLKLSAAVG